MRIDSKHGARGSLVSFAVLAALASACGAGKHGAQAEAPEAPKATVTEGVTNQDPRVRAEVGDGATSFQVLGGAEVKRLAAANLLKDPAKLRLPAGARADEGTTVVPTGHADAATVNPASLYVGFPVSLLGEGHLFGGVITKVSVKDSEKLGRLKLTDLTPLHVRPLLAKDGQDYFIQLNGCVSNCTETSAQSGLIALPVVGVTEDESQLVVDLADFGKQLDMMDLMDPDGQYTGLKTIATTTSYVDFSSSTLVYDVEHVMIPKDADENDGSVARTTITARWYLKLESGLNSAFTVRKPVDGVGFFGTSRNKDEKINRWGLTSFNGDKPVHYFIKNVPAEHHAAFAKAFDDWNETFKAEAGKEILSYEFVAADDARAANLVPGDVRYNILEWDLDNLAPYGGLGPSVASQTTGELFSANVLVQGPKIVEIYSDWWGVAADVQALKAAGKEAEADKRFVEGRRALMSKLPKPEASKLAVSLAGKLALNVASQDPRYEDPAAARGDFLALPDGETYETYMKGYWGDLVTHELGHNMGLRHNFRGNLFADKSGETVSASIMEYLNRSFRHKSKIGVYDHMAIAYAYAGKKPTRLDMFCTDENVPSEEDFTLSPECSRDDATNDPYTYLESVAQRAVDFLVNRGSTRAPEWTLADVDSNLTWALNNLATYAASAQHSAAQWTNWHTDTVGAARPTELAAIRAFVLDRFHGMLCGPAVSGAVAQKKGKEAKEKTQKNIDDLYAKVAKVAAAYELGDALKCQ